MLIYLSIGYGYARLCQIRSDLVCARGPMHLFLRIGIGSPRRQLLLTIAWIPPNDILGRMILGFLRLCDNDQHLKEKGQLWIDEELALTS
jgi:hypothetical protein